ncbi:MADF domain-containing protein [Heracleum sosnowskyi]|uniref:MADF domain-containing protein n=1 Tax=Heracleum sosnowskyi TaxID=360622 RepID=A0AAD8IZJ1_9APIA|nr:MADF domain-containing protein [Heracleum sosnowskyi]
MTTPSLSPQDLQNPSPVPPPQPSGTTTSRRLPPPCWSHDETVALIDSYREKWYSLRRGNLRACHWQEVADSVALRSPNEPSKTSVQCRHKMEKLRKRYRNEIQRLSSAVGRNRFNSSWVHFGRMDCMEKGPTAVALPVIKNSIEEDEDDDEEDDDEDIGFYPKSVRNGYGLSGNGSSGVNVCSWNRIPGRGNMVSPTPLTMYNKFDGGYSTPKTSDVANFGGFKDGRFGMAKNGNGERERVEIKKESDDPAMELVGAIKALGDGFVRMERMKMDMVREVEAMRMDMEMKKTEMILESQQRILESFVNAVSDGNNKKAKRMSNPSLGQEDSGSMVEYT